MQVNVAKARGYLFANIPISLITFAINMWAGITILGKERTGIHCLIVFDCVINVVSSKSCKTSQIWQIYLCKKMKSSSPKFVAIYLFSWDRILYEFAMCKKMRFCNSVSLHTSFLQSPWSMMGSPIPCLFNLIALHLLTAWNRLVPVAIAAFRYIMVCHAVFVHNHGGEKKVGS